MSKVVSIRRVVHELLVNQCVTCESFPCVCRIDTVWCRCACGGVLGASRDDLLSKHVAVIRHNAGAQHLDWRATRTI
jgi:hypothetical protein